VTGYIYTPPNGIATMGVAHLSTDGQTEDCATKPAGYREQGGTVGNPKAEDLLAARLAHGNYRRCRKCWRIGPKYGRRQ
jgi:hypothetical protein